jgi:3-hydroxyacyl-[acyl-carrier-protein] dehydratase
MDIEIEAILPHRPPFLWIDHVVEVDPGRRCVASKYIEPDAPVFAGHFPGDPILPGVLLIECAAQTAGVMLGAGGREQGGEKRLAAVNQFKFLEPVRPGSTVQVETRTLVEQEGMALVSASITVQGRQVAMGQLTVVSR